MCITRRYIRITKYKVDLKIEIARFKKTGEKMDYVNKLKEKKVSDIPTASMAKKSDILPRQDIGGFTYSLSNIDQCKVGNYTEKHLHERYFQNPDNLISILNIMENTKISIKKQKIFEKFKQQIRNKKQLKLVKIKFYLEKMKEELQTPKTKNIER